MSAVIVNVQSVAVEPIYRQQASVHISTAVGRWPISCCLSSVIAAVNTEQMNRFAFCQHTL